MIMESFSLIAIHAKEFKTKVNKVIENIEEQNEIYRSLKKYQESKSVQQLVKDLQPIIGLSSRQHLFADVRCVVMSHHLSTYDQLIPENPKDAIYVIKIRKTGNDGFGFTIRGGLEHGVGIFVSSVRRGSKASIGGLRAGDEILRINGLVLKDSTHEEVVNILRGRKHLILQVKREGKLPSKINDNIQWEEVKDKENPLYSRELLNFLLEDASATTQSVIELQTDDRRVEINKGTKSLGCSIRNSTSGVPGIFVVSVKPNSVSDYAGLQVGDMIIAVNGKDFRNIRYAEAVHIMKSSKTLSMVVRHHKRVEAYIRNELIAEIPEETNRPPTPPARTNKKSDKIPAFAVKTELLVRMSEREKRLREEGIPAEDDALTTTTVQKTVEPSFDMQDQLCKRTNFTDCANVIIAAENEQGITSPASPRSPLFPNPSNCEYSDDVLEGRRVSLVTIEKVADLGMSLEEKEGRILVKEIMDEGCIKEHGVINVGDQLLNVEGTNLINVSLRDAELELEEAMKRRSNSIDLVVAFQPKDRSFSFNNIPKTEEKVEEEAECYDTWL